MIKTMYAFKCIAFIFNYMCLLHFAPTYVVVYMHVHIWFDAICVSVSAVCLSHACAI